MALNYQRSGNAQIDAMLKALRERAIVGFGDPNLTGVGFSLDPATAAQARANYLSGNATLARLDRGNTIARQAIINSLAGHGLLHSGGLGFREGEQGRLYGNQVYDARQQLIDYLTKAAQDAQDRRNALQQTVMQAYMDAYANGYSGPLPDFSGGGSVGGVGVGPAMSGKFEMPFTPAGYTSDQTAAAASAYAQAHGYTPHMVMQEGTVTYQNGQPGVMVKYIDRNGLSTTEWTPLPQPGTAPQQTGGGGYAAPQANVVSSSNPFGLNLA